MHLDPCRKSQKIPKISPCCWGLLYCPKPGSKTVPCSWSGSALPSLSGRGGLSFFGQGVRPQNDSMKPETQGTWLQSVSRLCLRGLQINSTISSNLSHTPNLVSSTLILMCLFSRFCEYVYVCVFAYMCACFIVCTHITPGLISISENVTFALELLLEKWLQKTLLLLILPLQSHTHTNPFLFASYTMQWGPLADGFSGVRLFPGFHWLWHMWLGHRA